MLLISNIGGGKAAKTAYKINIMRTLSTVTVVASMLTQFCGTWS